MFRRGARGHARPPGGLLWVCSGNMLTFHTAISLGDICLRHFGGPSYLEITGETPSGYG